MQSSKAAALGIVGARAMARFWREESPHRSLIFLGLSFHDGNIWEWKKFKACGMGAVLLDLHIFGGHIKAKKSRGVHQVAKPV